MKTVTTKADRLPIKEGFLNMLVPRNEIKNLNCYAHVVLEPTDVVNFHVHNNEMEIYYFIKGEGIYNDNGTEVKVSAGSVTYTADGCGHGIRCAGDEPIEFIALIVAQ